VDHAKSALAMQEMETHKVLESHIGLNKFIDTAEFAGFDFIYVKPYPPPNRIVFNIEEYREFVRGQKNFPNRHYQA
jgi:hypothetical protein